MKKETRWPIIIATAMVLHVVAWLAVAYLAVSDSSFAVEENYYEKALAWNEHQKQQLINRELNWHVEAQIELKRDGLAKLRLRLQSPKKEPITGAQVAITAFPIARSNQRIQATATESSDGWYEADLTTHRPGRWEVRMIARRHEVTYTHTDVVYAAPLQNHRSGGAES